MLGQRESDDSVIGEVHDASTGNLLSTVSFDDTFRPQGIEVLTSFGGSSAPELAVHGVRTSDGAVRAEVRDASTETLLKNVYFNANYVFP
jgi:hypothetical protein